MGFADLGRVALGSWADEMEDMPMPCEFMTSPIF